MQTYVKTDPYLSPNLVISLWGCFPRNTEYPTTGRPTGPAGKLSLSLILSHICLTKLTNNMSSETYKALSNT